MPVKTTALLNALTALVAAVALVLGSVRIHELVSNRLRIVRPAASVSDWRDYGEGGIQLGPRDAPVTLVMFSDFQCIHCQAAAPAVDALREEFGDRLRFVYRNLPLSSASWRHALTAVCGHAEGAFESVYGHLFRSRSNATVDGVALAATLGIANVERFGACLAGESARAAIAADTTAAANLGVTGTPWFLVDSLLFRGNVGARTLRLAVLASLGEREPVWQRVKHVLSPQQ